MLAKTVCVSLNKRGICTLSFDEGSEEVDGMVAVTPQIHIQVPTFGNDLHVVRETADKCLYYYPTRFAIDSIVSDIRRATKDVELGNN